MAVNITRRTPTWQDINHLAGNMRQCDRDELCAVTDLSPLAAVLASVASAHPDHLFAAHADGELLCIGGCSITGNPWLLATDAIHRHTRLLTSEARRGVRAMQERWPVLGNVVDARNTQAIKWLKTLGFQFSPDTLEINPGFPVIQFKKVRDA